MIISPFIRLFRRFAPPGLPSSIPSIPLPFSSSSSSTSSSTSASPGASTSKNGIPVVLAFIAALQRLDLSRDPRKTLAKLSRQNLTLRSILPYAFFSSIALYCLYIMRVPLLLRLFIPSAYILAILLPITSQLIWPATPVLTWVILFFTARFIPSKHRPTIHVALLPALESVLYGANISDLQTRYTNPIMDIFAWIPYGVAHFSIPAVVALVLWALGPRKSPQYWGKAFGWLNLIGVMTQILFPCAAPWYEIIHGLTPADYSMPGSPGGLLRIDRVLHTSAYTNAFGAAPLVFGAFPSLHSGCAVMEALFLSHFFPAYKPFYWCYVGLLWWATMYLSHHYLIDLTGGACLSVAVFYITMPEMFKDVDQIIWTREEEGRRQAPMFKATMDVPNGGLAMAYELGQERNEHEGDEESRDGHGKTGLEGMTRREEAQSPISGASANAIGSGSGRVLFDAEQGQTQGGSISQSTRVDNIDEEARIGGQSDGAASTVESTPPTTNWKKPKRKVSWGENSVFGEDTGKRAGEDDAQGDS